MKIFIDLFFYGLVVFFFIFILRKKIRENEKEFSDLLKKNFHLELEIIRLKTDIENLEEEKQQLKAKCGKIRSLCFRYDKPFDNREREILEKNNFEFIKHNIANALVNKFIEDDFLQIKDKDDYYECEIDFL